MKNILLNTIVIAATLSATLAQASLDFSAVTGSSIEFAGTASTFNIIPDVGTGHQWDITGSDGGLANGLFGTFAGGPWSYGAITVNGVDQSANVTTPTGTFTINDGAGFLATGNINWVQVNTHSYAGGVNAGATVNITGMTYGGVNADLLALVASSFGSIDMTFQFNPGKTLTDLTLGTGPYDNSYSGSLVGVVPEPTTVVAGALLLLPLAAGGLRTFRRNRAANRA